MDLSLRQNVDAAQGLFKPFYEDDLIVKDLVYTKQFKKNVQLAQAYKDLGSILGFMYAERISPISIFVNRNYYSKSKSCPELSEAVSFIKLDDWETAKNVWEDGLKRCDKKPPLISKH